MTRSSWITLILVILIPVGIAAAADTVPTDVQQPGTQPGEVGNLESPDKCDNCHGGYDEAVEPAYNWRGSMMAQASRDPIFWATMAIAEQDFDGAGDLCIRCHSVDGWNAGRSTPTDGSGLGENDATGVACDLCHKLTNPDMSEHLGIQNDPFQAYDDLSPDPNEGYYGSGMYVLWGGSAKLGPYSDAEARHQWMQSNYHRSVDLCGTCHDVSNPVVGNLAPGHGTQAGMADAVIADDILGGPVDGKAAFNNPAYSYGVVERTFSEYKAGLLSQTLVSDYNSLPAELQAGSILDAYMAATAAGNGGDYEDGTPRYFSCQTCHLPPTTGVGCNKKGAPIRSDLPLHDMTGGNYWMPDVIEYLDNLGKLRLGGGLSDVEKAALDSGELRAINNLQRAAGLDVSGNTVTVTNLTGHKLISGYPEGRRMWLNVKWYDGTGGLVDEYGAYGDLAIDQQALGLPVATVRTLLDLHDTQTRIYEAHYGVTQEWAAKLLAVDPAYAGVVLEYDRVTGVAGETLGDLAAEPAGTVHETFHFVLNDSVKSDNRIPPYGMDFDEAKKRNALPVPSQQFGDPGPGGAYDHHDSFDLTPPTNAVHATVDLVYQPTSWEYILFLYLGNDGTNPFLAEEGINLMDAWLNTGMAAPVVMASATWGDPPQPVCDDDGLCEMGEDCSNCPNDCISGGGGEPCGNGVCETDLGENCLTCAADCNGKTKGKNQFCCGIGDGQPPETDGCVGDTRCNSEGWLCQAEAAPAADYCCGDEVCTAPFEDCGNCSLDCGDPLAEVCSNGVDDDCDGLVDCDDPDCGGDPTCCASVGESCRSDEECCAPLTCQGRGKNKTCQ